MDKLLKRKKEEEEQQRLQEALEEFQQTFEDGSGKHVPKTFIRGDIVNANKSMGSLPSVYKPVPIQNKPLQTPQNIEKAKKIAEETARKIMHEASQNQNKIPPNRPPKPGAKKVVQSNRMTNLEIFKEELKQVQQMREERKGLRQQLQEKLGADNEAIDRIAPPLDNPYLTSGVSEFEDDPSTTNLYVCNMALDIQMEDLYETFGSFGPLASAKILYPRNDEERRRDHLCGFIAFISRNDAERAWCAMSGEKVKGSELRVSWARPVPIPPVPFYVPIPLRELAMPDPPSGLPFNAKPITSDLREFLRKYGDLPRLNAPLPPDNPALVEDYQKMISNSVVRVVQVSDRALLMLIHRVVEYLVREGPLFEAIIMARERNNAMYRFLFENHHPTHVYYRWKLYSILQGEDKLKWRLERFRMFENGSWWEPPPHSLFENGMPPQLYDTAYVPARRGTIRYEKMSSLKKRRARDSSNSGSDDEKAEKSDPKKHRGILEDRDREAFEEVLRNLVPEKNSVGDAMVWCVEHADCAKEIVQCIYEALCIRETPLHKKIARVYLISDILANCGARLRDVFYFRQYFGDVLQKVFVVLNETLEGIASRLKAEQFRSRVMLCFRMWEDNALYPTDVLINMQNIFLGLTKPNGSEQGSDDGDDLDGEPLAEDIADIDGLPLDDDFRTENLGSRTVPPSENPMFKESVWSQVVDTEAEPTISVSKWDSIESSKWDTPQDVVTPFVVKNDADHGHRKKDDEDAEIICLYTDSNNKDIEEQLAESSNNSKENEEERRKMLRDIEVKVVKLQDELESDNCKNVDEEISNYRKKLTLQMDDKLARSASKRSNSSKDKHKKEKEKKKSSDDKEEISKHSKERSDSKSEHNSSNRDKERSREESNHHRSSEHRDDSKDKDRERRSHRDEESRSTRDSRVREERHRTDDRDREKRRDRTPERRRR